MKGLPSGTGPSLPEERETQFLAGLVASRAGVLRPRALLAHCEQNSGARVQDSGACVRACVRILALSMKLNTATMHNHVKQLVASDYRINTNSFL